MILHFPACVKALAGAMGAIGLGLAPHAIPCKSAQSQMSSPEKAGHRIINSGRFGMATGQKGHWAGMWAWANYRSAVPNLTQWGAKLSVVL